MPVSVHLRQLAKHPVTLHGAIEAAELDLGSLDELVRPIGPLQYEVHASNQGDGVLVQGELSMVFQCECARCLHPFQQVLSLKDWTRLLQFDGDEAVVVVDDSVDLTPCFREDMVLALPHRPLCSADCVGVPQPVGNSSIHKQARIAPPTASSVWDELDKLNF